MLLLTNVYELLTRAVLTKYVSYSLPPLLCALNPNQIKVKESRYRPGVAQRVPGGSGSQIFMTFGT
jgi:hypothetical protein